MHQELFDKYKGQVIAKVNNDLANDFLPEQQRADLNRVLDILDKHYRFDNWKFHQGLLSHTIIDSMDLPNETSGALITFDKYLY